ncbi:MAG: ABC transporter ATP-binding protein [Cohaesibacteraceae bacterium]|nr:ABC transporter ATP-binding protein [Cohaesibacteraceae bacterium]
MKETKLNTAEDLRNKIFPLLIGLFRTIKLRRRLQFVFLLILIFATSAAEIVSIGAVIPFLGVLSVPQKIFDLPWVQPVIELFNLSEPDQLLLPMAIIFVVAAVVAAAMRMSLLIVQTRLSFATGRELSLSIYRRTLFQPYSKHATQNSSEVINAIIGKAGTVTSGVILPVLNLISGIVMLGSILLMLFYVEPEVALTVFGGFGLLYALIISLTRKQLLADGFRIALYSTTVLKTLQEGFGGIRDVVLHGSQNIYCESYKHTDYLLRRSQGNQVIIGQSPRFLIETIGIVLMTILAYTLTKQSDGLLGAIPILGTLAFGAQRLLPVLQQGYQSWSSIRSSQSSLYDTLALLGQPLPQHAEFNTSLPIPFNSSIDLKGISFRYHSDSGWVIQNIDLKIAKGSRIGFIGATGSGKSTIIDVVMGLLNPTEGHLEIDGKLIDEENQHSWQKHISHVPQSIFLADCSIASNIAFGVPEDQINMENVRKAASQAQISDTIECWDNGYQTIVGERGIRLSGGQRQRIGIARALYRKADVIVFDEATSALDSETEEAVMEAIDNLSTDLTIILIAHRYSTLRTCTEIIKVTDGSISSIGTYQALMNLSDQKL